jgi:phosphate starvation-inducible protein PhoH
MICQLILKRQLQGFLFQLYCSFLRTKEQQHPDTMLESAALIFGTGIIGKTFLVEIEEEQRIEKPVPETVLK